MVSAGVYVEEGPDRDALTEALARENYLPVYLDPRTVLSTHSLCLAYLSALLWLFSIPKRLFWYRNVIPKFKVRNAWEQ